MVPALALGTEQPEPGIMDKPPRNLNQHIITPSILLRAYGWLGIIQSIAAMAAFYFVYWMNGHWGEWLDLPDNGELYSAATTMTLAAVVVTQIGNLFAQRTERISVFSIGLLSNRLVWVGVAVEVVLLLLIIYVPFLQNFFDTVAIPLHYWLFLLAWMPALLLADELRKLLLRAFLRQRQTNDPSTIRQPVSHPGLRR